MGSVTENTFSCDVKDEKYRKKIYHWILSSKSNFLAMKNEKIKKVLAKRIRDWNFRKMR